MSRPYEGASRPAKFRLMQARKPGDPVRSEEVVCFAARLGVPVSHIAPFDCLSEQVTFSAVVEGVDAVLIGGSGDYSIYHPDPWLRPFIDTIGELAWSRFPTFASCFGFQGLVVAMGGVVRADPASAEVGTFDISLTRAAADDELFGGLPRTFSAQLGHNDRAIELPNGVTLLARSERCPYQAIRVDGAPFYATQFHPELSAEDNRARYARYAAKYGDAAGATPHFASSVEANSLLALFRRQLVESAWR
jgi:GMP synthase (glutamine-hydrolysing)